MNDTTVPSTDTSDIDDVITAAADGRIDQLRREEAIRHISANRRLTLGDLARYCCSQQYGALLSAITLDDVLGIGGSEREQAAQPAPKAPKAPSKKAAAPKAKAPKAPAKKTAAPAKTKASPKSGKQKFDREEIYGKITSFVKAKKEVSLGDIVGHLGFTRDQVIVFVREMKKADKIKQHGAASKTRYTL